LEPLIKFILRTSEGVFEDYVPLDEEVVAARLKLPITTITEQLHSLNRLNIFSYQPRKNSPQVILLTDRVKKNELRLDEKFIAERKKQYMERLQAMQKYVTETNVCRTLMLVRYFGEVTSEDCGICDVCVGRKRAGLSAKEFTDILCQLENVLQRNALPTHDLYRQLSIKKENLDIAIEYLIEAGRVTKNEEGNLQWTL
jgi:ATP-dependent DNA helicase RecQ